MSRVAARWRATRAARRRFARRLTGVALLGVSGYLGGLGATSLVPTPVETANYSARIRLSPLPTAASTVHSPTLFGDIDLDFEGPVPAPGIDATVQVKKSITTLLAERNVSVAALQPSDAEVTAAIQSASVRLGLTFSAGTVFVSVVGLGLLAYGRRRRLTWHHLVLAGATAATVLVTTGVATALTYRPGNLGQFRTSGLISTVRENAGLLGEVEDRARQATPYLRNLLALSQALREKYNPESLDQPVGVRLLLVSDVHGANQYPLMSQIVADEHIDAVVDLGDLLNFGSVAEADAAGIFASIERLGVPYLFVRGNHDATSPTDQSLLARMARVPNVTVLEPQPGRYAEVSVRGLRIGGFNDPRYFGDDNRDNAAEQVPAAERFAAAFAGRDPLDLVAAHEPAAVAAVPASVAGGIRVHGHMHSRQLTGDTVGVGTFTGGGTVYHFGTGEPATGTADDPAGEDDELTGQPYSFDIAAFGQQCALASLTRYTYRDLVSGRPAYDDVSVISGRSVSAAEPAGRSCSASNANDTLVLSVPTPEPVATSTG
ncbi:MAG TPA: metallophosphoesterase family protein [Dermatophilaceae bacterium]|nr:metallophosphoesterase family protein [Dermatophilaceae bacterium]